jgi:hypothetical protein
VQTAADVKRGGLLRRVIIAFVVIMLTSCAGLSDRHSGVESDPVKSAARMTF